MGSIRQYFKKLKRGVFHRSEAFAAEGGIFFGPGRDPKGNFYSPRLGIYWYEPDTMVPVKIARQDKGWLESWFDKLVRVGRRD